MVVFFIYKEHYTAFTTPPHTDVVDSELAFCNDQCMRNNGIKWYGVK